MPVRETRKLIAVDLDQTLSDTLECLIEWHNHTYHSQLKLIDFHTLDYWKVWGGTKEESCQKIRAFYESQYFDSIKPIKDYALEALKALKKRHFRLVIVTSRQQFIAEKTKKFVDRHYSGIFDSIYFCNLNLSEIEQQQYISKPKSLICQEIGVHVLIEDSLEHASGCSQLKMDVLLYDKQGKYKWNHGQQLPQNVQRVYNWKQVMTQFPKPTSPLKHCIYSSFEEMDCFHETPCQYETIEVEEEFSDDELCFTWTKENAVCV
ncbi:hypothetical protein G6F56_010536 [Rhizopus delemar]|nr:hypothetical protein G6F56_010536 [Rhizopus delemar]